MSGPDVVVGFERKLATAEAENAELRRHRDELRGLVRKLDEVVRSKGLVPVTDEMRAQIDQEALAE